MSHLQSEGLEAGAGPPWAAGAGPGPRNTHPARRVT
jgi:hypothetical protein